MASPRDLLCAILLSGVICLAAQPNPQKAKKPSMRKALAELKVPPDWCRTTPVRYDTRKPWKEARLEIRRRLGLGDRRSLREAMKLTYLYHKKNDIGDGHEYPMYLFLGGETAWAVKAYRSFIAKLAAGGKVGHTNAYLSLAACYVHFGEYDKALQIANDALRHLPKPPWDVPNEAHVHDVLGDVYAAMGDKARAKQHYRKAVRLHPRSRQPYGRHLLRRKAAKVQAKLDMLALEAIQPGKLRDGTYTGRSLGYVGDILVTVTVRGRRIAAVTVTHKENIPLGSTEIIPRRIVEQQALNVDAVTGATCTSDAIRDGAFQALKKAGLK